MHADGPEERQAELDEHYDAEYEAAELDEQLADEHWSDWLILKALKP